MLAIVYHNYGPPDVLRVEEVPTPKPNENEILMGSATVVVKKAVVP